MRIVFNPNIKDVYDGYTEAVETVALDISERYFDIYSKLDEIKSVAITLIKAPEEELASFNELYANAQAAYNRVSAILIEFIGERAFWKRQLIIANKIYNRAKNYLLTSDEIKNLRNKILQEARVEDELYLIVSLVATIKGTLDDIKDMVEIAIAKKEELDNAIMNMNRQQRITESLIGLGYPVKPHR